LIYQQIFTGNPFHVALRIGGGTLFKVGGGTSALRKDFIANFVVWIGSCDVTSIELWHHYIYTIWRSKLYYFRQNYTTM